MTILFRGAAFVAVCLLASCGGGGGSSSPSQTPPAAQSYPLHNAFMAYVEAGSSVNLTASGSFCAATATLTLTPSAALTFDGASAIGTVQTLTASGCSPELVNVRTLYYDTN